MRNRIDQEEERKINMKNICHKKKRKKMKSIYTCYLSTTLTNKDLQKRRRNPEAVSYTHLDVYKRQEHY